MPGTVIGAGTILDARGNPYRAPRDPLSTRDRGSVTEVFRDLPISPLYTKWTVSSVEAALVAHTEGQFFSSGRLIDSISTDDRVISALGARVGALLGLETFYERADEDADGAVLAAWSKAWPSCIAPPEQGDQTDAIKRTAHMAGFSVSEIVWDTSVTPWQPYLKPWDTSLFYYDRSLRSLIALTEDGPEVVTPGDGKWFVHAPGGVHRAWMSGLVTPLALPWFLRMLARRDWARYSERHGMPLLKAKMPSLADAEDKKRFESDLVTMGSEAVVTLPQGFDGEGFDVELLEAAAQSWEGFDRLITRCESAITLTVQWQNLTTEVKEGSLAAARVHGDVKQTAIVLDERAWADDVQAQIGRPFAAYNFGNPNAAPRTRRDVTPLEDRLARTQALESFSRALATLLTAGAPVDVPSLAREYRVPLPLAKEIAKQAPIFAYHMTAGVVTRNEVRARLGLPPIPGPKGEELLGDPANAAAPATSSTTTTTDGGE